MTFIDRMVSLFVSPGKLMENIKAYPKAWLPLLVCILISLASLPLTIGFAEIQTQEFSIISIERYGVDYFALGAAADFDDEDDAQATYQRTVGYAAVLTAFISYPLLAALSALMLFILCKIMRGQGTYQQYFSLFAHVYIITAVCAAVTMGACIAFDNSLDILSLAAVFMPQGNITDSTYNLLYVISLPRIWMFALIFIALRYINEWSAAKSAVGGGIAFVSSVLVNALYLNSTFVLMDFSHNMLSNL
jgi:hypothetical protein